MQYYSSNALLEHIRQHDNFFVPPLNSWLLLYSDINFFPLVQLNVAISEIAKLDDFPKILDSRTGNLVVFGQGRYGLRWSESLIYRNLDESSLYEEFISRGLIEKKEAASKPFNKYASSEYHIWQNSHRFIGGVADIDAMRVDSKGCITEIFEIKRSKIPPERWFPYREDKGGYEILANAADGLGCKFTIVYYHYLPNNGYENYEKLLVLDKSTGFTFTNRRYCSIDELIRGHY